MNQHARRARTPVLVTIGCVLVAVVVAVIAGTLMAILGANLACLGGDGGATGLLEQPTRAAVREIPPKRLRLYQQAGRRFDVDWTVLASIGTQECGTGLCAHVYPSGCGGPMQIAIERESACSPGAGPTIWERYGVDASGDGEADPFSLADAIFTAARLLRVVMGAPPIGGTYAAYRQAACNYYGACADSIVDYADEVMERAVEYGFHGKGAPAPSNPAATKPASYGAAQGSSCGASITGGASGSEIVRIAQSQLGQTEIPLGSNCTKYGPCVEWCSLFVAWVWEKAGVPLHGGTAPYAYSGSIYEWAQAHEGGGLPGKRSPGGNPFLETAADGAQTLPPGATPAPGDAVLFGSGPGFGESDHVGIVERVFPDGEITTIDGNYGDRVARVGPFLPAEAVAKGEPAPIYGYAQPPSGKAGVGEGG
jgi:CHAP domain